MKAPKTKLLKILTSLETADQELESSDLQTQLLLELSKETDSIKLRLMELESSAKELQVQIDKLREQKARITIEIEDLEAEMLNAFKEKGIEKQPGLKYVATLVRRSNFVTDCEPDYELEFAFPGLVRTKRSWIVEELKAAMKKDPRPFFGVAHWETKESIRFTSKES